MLAAEPHHLCNLFESLLAIDPQLVFEVQIRRGEENMQAGLGGGFESSERGIYIFLAGAGERCYARVPDFSGYRACGIEVSRGRNGETRFDNICAEFLDLMGKPQLFLFIHGKARRLLAISQRCIEDLQNVHLDSSR
jgi:hypothetical protein